MEEQRISDNRPITERIKTFEDALDYLEYRAKELADQTAYNLSKDWHTFAGMMLDASTKAYLQLAIITYALNEGWQPEFMSNEILFYPCFRLRDVKAYEIGDWRERSKDKENLWLVGDISHDGLVCAFIFSRTLVAWLGQRSIVSARLVYRWADIAEYAGRQFTAMYARFYLGDKGLTAKPWREFEKEIKKKS